MLVNSVCLVPPRRVSADIAEIIAAIDEFGIGNVLYGTIVDDPASVDEFIDAFIGDPMLEAASASDAPDASTTYGAAIDETIEASASQDAISDLSAVVSEAATAVDVVGVGFPVRASLITQQVLFTPIAPAARSSLITVQILRTVT